MRRPKILISACLVGEPVRYDGRARTLAHQRIGEWRSQGQLVPICPELASGLPVPRPAAEISDGGDGGDVLAGTGRVSTSTGIDVTDLYLAGAQAALDLARAACCRFALLTDGSPSCGSTFIYDGSFTKRRQMGAGVTAALLRSHGIEVFSEADIEALAQAAAMA